MQGLLNHVADSALSIRAAGIQRDRMQDVAGQFRAEQNKAYLWPVAVRDDHVPTLINHLGNMHGCFSYRVKLVRYSFVRFVFDQ